MHVYMCNLLALLLSINCYSLLELLCFVAYTDLNTKKLDMYAVFIHFFILVAVISGQNCSDIVGSSNKFYNNSDYPVVAASTYIIADHKYTVPCKGKVIAWNFCYRSINKTTAVSFTAGIWINTSNNTYKEVNSTIIEFIPNRINDSVNPCQTIYLLEANQFVAPIGSIVGLYSNTEALLLYSNSNIATYMYDGNKTQYQINDNKTHNYMIAINVHLG